MGSNSFCIFRDIISVQEHTYCVNLGAAFMQKKCITEDELTHTAVFFFTSFKHAHFKSFTHFCRKLINDAIYIYAYFVQKKFAPKPAAA